MTEKRPDTFTEDKAVPVLKKGIESKNIVDSSQTSNRQYKASLFEEIFNSRSEALALYNALNGTNYQSKNDLIITTLQGALFMGYKNDVSFIVGAMLNLYEHQSSFNPNMPVRGLSYFAQSYENYIAVNGFDVYSSTRLKLPKAQYYVFYNGRSDQPDRQILRLSDSFPDDGLENHLEVTAVMLNINYGHNRELMEKCKPLHDYALFVSKVRSYLEAGYNRTKALELAVNECISKDILKNFLVHNRTGVMSMLYDEYYWELHKKKVYEEMRQEVREEMRQEVREEMLAEGWSSAVLCILSLKGEIPDEINRRICSEDDQNVLATWLQTASKVNTVDDFIKRM